MKIDLNPLRELESQGIISIQQHSTLPLLILNYTQRCQWERAWNEVTLQCRGLITDLSGHIVCRPFPKFFNLGEHLEPESKLPPINWRQDFYVSEKMDGSLGIVYPTPDGLRLATRGSFVSDQAIRGTAMLHRLGLREMRQEHTYLFEIIYPENRIVLHYGDTEALVLLDVVNNETGHGLPRSELELEARILGCDIVASYTLTADQLATYGSDEVNREGVVVRFEDGLRIKIKLGEYCRLHRLITGVNARHIWEYLKDGRSLDDLIDRVPDEFMNWVNQTAGELRDGYAQVDGEVRRTFERIKSSLGDAPRKAYAEQFKHQPALMGILFLMLDGHDYSETIWKQLRPKSADVFAVADE